MTNYVTSTTVIFHSTIFLLSLLALPFFSHGINSPSADASPHLHTASSSGLVNIPLGLLVSETGFQSGLDLAIASLMAVNDINRFLAANQLSDSAAKAAALSAARAQAPLDLSYLNQPFILTPLMNDTQLSPTVGLLSALYQIQEQNVVGIVGDTGSSVCESIQLLAALFHVPTVSFSCTSPDLSNRALYPTFYRTVPSDSLQGSTLGWIVSSYGWKNVAILATNDAYALGISGTFQTSASVMGINVLVRVIFNYGSTAQQATAAVAQVKASGARVVVLCGVAQDLTNVFQAAINLGMMSAQYVWIGPDGLYDMNVYSTLSQPVKGVLATSPYAGLGLPSYQKFQALWLNNSITSFPSLIPYINAYYAPTPSAIFAKQPFAYAMQTYDAVLMYAVAINELLAAQAASGSTLQITSTMLNTAFSNSNFNFTGVSGYLSFNQGDRLANYQLYNLGQNGEFVSLGVVSPTAPVPEGITSATVFYDGTNNIPSDESEITVAMSSVVAMIVLMAIEVVWILFCMGFTLWFRERPVIKASSPEFLLVICAGLLFGLSSIPLLALNGDRYCRSYPFLLGVSYTTVFAALFIKTYRVAYIFNRTKLKVVGHQVRTKRLLVYVSAAVAGELLFNLAWLLSNPDQMTKNSENNGSFYSACGGGKNFTEWLSVSYAYKGLALVWGVVLAVRVRSVHSYFNESKYVISCIFILAFTAIIVPSAFYTSNSPSIRFFLECLWILVVCAYIPAVLFVPKVYTLMYEPDSTGVAANVSMATPGKGIGTGTSDSSIQGPRGPALIPIDQIVAPGVCVKAESAGELRAIIDALQQAMEGNDLSSLQHAFYKGVKAAGLLPVRPATGVLSSAGSGARAQSASANNSASKDKEREKEREEKRRSVYTVAMSPRSGTLLQKASVRASIPTINVGLAARVSSAECGSDRHMDVSAGSTSIFDDREQTQVEMASPAMGAIPETRSVAFLPSQSPESMSPSHKRRSSGNSMTPSTVERTRPPAMNRI